LSVSAYVILILHVCAYIIVFRSPGQVKAVLFDHGNVLSRPLGRAEEPAMAAILNSPIARFREVHWADRAAFDRAAIRPEDYWDTVANRLSRTLTETERQRITELDNLSWSYPEPTMVEWATALHQGGMKTGIFQHADYATNHCGIAVGGYRPSTTRVFPAMSGWQSRSPKFFYIRSRAWGKNLVRCCSWTTARKISMPGWRSAFSRSVTVRSRRNAKSTDINFTRADLPAGRFRSARVSVSLIFLIHGILVSSWTARIPAVKEKLGIPLGTVGAVLLSAAAGALVCMPLTSRLVGGFGSARMTQFTTGIRPGWLAD
jgi:hypothetical protein